MPRFYLHLGISDNFIEDEEGCDLPDLAHARKRAIEGLRDVSAGELRRGNIDLGSFIEIEDENHALVMTVPLSEAVRITTRSGQRT
jgi:hypothetical protein